MLASIPDADQRFAVIGEPPVLARTGERRWTEDEAKRRVGRQVTPAGDGPGKGHRGARAGPFDSETTGRQRVVPRRKGCLVQ
ncbi:DUF6192 family protein [Actinoplanes teichomyceticus]|uniref:DUF6192 family protein n=1 Tax=Actinoplanes teichomyceticus TaxID=1867 RepID=UPI003555CEF7